jgi:hypothetical protein
MDKQTLKNLREIEYIQNECLKEIISIRESKIIDADRLNDLWDEYYNLEDLKKMLLTKQKYVGGYLISYNIEDEFIKIHINDNLEYEETIDFAGMFINVDKDLNLKTIDYERGNLDEFFESLNEEKLEIVFHIVNDLIEHEKILRYL